jgi:1-aminocyclopropane-1-carboxylate deaminase/D-cysteine desulfhydrase-like pyridoxal-dependent ACC family enzyme
VCLPGGTCSTAALVSCAIQQLLREQKQQQSSGSTNPGIKKDVDIRVVVIPCVGDEQYARRQMLSLSLQAFGDECSLDSLPTVLPPTPNRPQYIGQTNTDNKYFPFGEPHASVLITFRELKDKYGIVLDLLYGSPSWTILLRHFRVTAKAGMSFDPEAPLAGREIMYVHSGGLEGINTQMMRYKYKGLVDIADVQLPGR